MNSMAWRMARLPDYVCITNPVRGGAAPFSRSQSSNLPTLADIHAALYSSDYFFAFLFHKSSMCRSVSN